MYCLSDKLLNRFEENIMNRLCHVSISSALIQSLFFVIYTLLCSDFESKHPTATVNLSWVHPAEWKCNHCSFNFSFFHFFTSSCGPSQRVYFRRLILVFEKPGMWSDHSSCRNVLKVISPHSQSRTMFLEMRIAVEPIMNIVFQCSDYHKQKSWP